MLEIGARGADRVFFWLFVIRFNGAKFSASLSAEIAHQASDTLLMIYESAAPQTVDKPALSVSSDYHPRLSLHPVPHPSADPGVRHCSFRPEPCPTLCKSHARIYLTLHGSYLHSIIRRRLLSPEFSSA